MNSSPSSSPRRLVHPIPLPELTLRVVGNVIHDDSSNTPYPGRPSTSVRPSGRRATKLRLRSIDHHHRHIPPASRPGGAPGAGRDTSGNAAQCSPISRIRPARPLGWLGRIRSRSRRSANALRIASVSVSPVSAASARARRSVSGSFRLRAMPSTAILESDDLYRSTAEVRSSVKRPASAPDGWPAGRPEQPKLRFRRRPLSARGFR